MRQRRTTLEIRPGTRKLKFTVTIDGELVDYGTKYFKGVWSKEKMENVLQTVQLLFAKYEPSKPILNLPHPSRRSEGLDHLIKQLSLLGNVRLEKEPSAVEAFSQREKMRWGEP